MLLASCSYLPCYLKRCRSIHGFITYLCILWSGFCFHFLPVPFALSGGYLHFCYICHQSTFDIWLHIDTFSIFKASVTLLYLREVTSSFLSSHFKNFIPSSTDVRAALQKGARCHSRLASLGPHSGISVLFLSASHYVPDIVPKVLIEINSLDTGDAHLWYPMVLLHIRTVNRIFLNCFPNWNENIWESSRAFNVISGQ